MSSSRHSLHALLRSAATATTTRSSSSASRRTLLACSSLQHRLEEQQQQLQQRRLRSSRRAASTYSHSVIVGSSLGSGVFRGSGVQSGRYRMMSTKADNGGSSSSENAKGGGKEVEKEPSAGATVEDEAAASDSGSEGEGENGEQAAAAEPQPTREEELEKEVKDLKDQLLRSLAEQENTRRIAKRDVESARQYAVSSFAKSLLDTSDNLARAMEAVPEEYRSDVDNHPQLANLYEGIKMTDDNLTKAFAKHGLAKFGTVGDAFDPNMHDALFEYVEEGKDSGTLGQVMKVGFTLNGRVIRPAEVGVIKKG